LLFSATSRGFGYGYEAVRIRVKNNVDQIQIFLNMLKQLEGRRTIYGIKVSAE
jgi:thymidylate synthase